MLVPIRTAERADHGHRHPRNAMPKRAAGGGRDNRFAALPPAFRLQIAGKLEVLLNATPSLTARRPIFILGADERQAEAIGGRPRRGGSSGAAGAACRSAARQSAPPQAAGAGARGGERGAAREAINQTPGR